MQQVRALQAQAHPGAGTATKQQAGGQVRRHRNETHKKKKDAGGTATLSFSCISRKKVVGRLLPLGCPLLPRVTEPNLWPCCPQNPGRLAATSPPLCCTTHRQSHDQRLCLIRYSPRPQQQAVAAQHIKAVAARVTGAYCQLSGCRCGAAAVGQVQVGVDLQAWHGVGQHNTCQIR